MAFSPAIMPPKEHYEDDLLFIFREDRLIVRAGEDPCSIPTLGDVEGMLSHFTRKLYFGTHNGAHCYAADLTDNAPLPTGLDFQTMRSLYAMLPEDVLKAAGMAFEIVNWDRTHQYCGRCGSSTLSGGEERVRSCPHCGLAAYPRITPVVIVAVVKEGTLLLASHKSRKSPIYSLIAGFVETGESLEEAVKREVQEEVGLEIADIRYFGSQPWPFPSSLIAGFTALHESGDIRVDGREIGDAAWFLPGNFPPIPPPGSISRRLIDWFVESLSPAPCKDTTSPLILSE
jgi:NAD+ diphosphatase